MKINILREKSNKELKEIKKELEMQRIKSLVEKGVKSKKGPRKTNHKIFQEIRRTIARINTILMERK